MRLQETRILVQISTIAMEQDFHLPLVKGKCNRDTMEESVIDGIYNGVLPPMNHEDTEFVCELIDAYVKEVWV